MTSRMEKYYDKRNSVAKSRSSRNKDLYSDMYTYGKYSNIEGIAEINNANQVDITQVKELLKNRENYQKERKYRRLTGNYEEPKKEETIIRRRFPELDEKNYDIRDVLKEARENKVPDTKERSLRNTEYNILKNIDLKKALEKEKYYDLENEEDDLRELIQTITNTSMLNKIGDAELAADLLSDLKANDTQVGQLDNVKELIKEAEKAKTRQEVSAENNYDKSFFTSSLKLNKADFIDGDEEPQNKAFKIILTIILIVIIILCGVLLALKFL